MQSEPETKRRKQSEQTLLALHIPEALLKIRTVAAVTGMGERTIYRKVAEKKFPAPVRDGPRCNRWVAGTVSQWLKARGSAQ